MWLSFIDCVRCTLEAEAEHSEREAYHPIHPLGIKLSVSDCSPSSSNPVKIYTASTNYRIQDSTSLPVHCSRISSILTVFPAQTQSPVVKRETLGHSHSDWPLFQPTVDSLNLNEAYQIYSTTTSNSAPPQQPIMPVMMQATDPRPYHQAVQADTTAPLTAMRNNNTRRESSLSPIFLVCCPQ
jgi:hypothetical protein